MDGFTIRRFRDVVKAERKDGKCFEIAVAEGIIDSIVNISDWYNSFLLLQKTNKNIIVEKECFSIGKVIKVTKRKMI